MDIKLVNYWKDKYACQSSRESSSETAEHIVHEACTQNSSVEHFRIKGGNHWWPETIDGRSTHEVMWGFLKRYAL